MKSCKSNRLRHLLKEPTKNSNLNSIEFHNYRISACKKRRTKKNKLKMKDDRFSKKLSEKVMKKKRMFESRSLIAYRLANWLNRDSDEKAAISKAIYISCNKLYLLNVNSMLLLLFFFFCLVFFFFCIATLAHSAFHKSLLMNQKVDVNELSLVICIT